MFQVTTLRKMQIHFEAIKEELSSGMVLCMPSDDKFKRVMLTISQLLLKEVESVDVTKRFNASSILKTSLAVIDSMEDEENCDSEIVLLKFARSFILFMESLSGFYVRNTPHDAGAPQAKRAKPASNKEAPVGNGMVGDSGISVQYKKSRMTNPMMTPVASQRLPNLPGYDESPLPMQPSAHDNLFDALQSAGMSNSGSPQDTKIKMEEPDFDEVNWNNVASQSHQALEISQSDTVKHEVKEEPIEDPIVDTVNFCAKPTAPQQANQRKLTAHERAVLKKSRPCPICESMVHMNKMDDHVRVFHKGDWITHVQRCPENECDFRSNQSNIMSAHHRTVHNSIYEGWKNTTRLQFKAASTKCPFCKDQVDNVAQFINHMENHHWRFSTYDAPILKCDSCRFNSARCNQMFMHWQRSPQCSEGMGFLYENAREVINADNMLKSKEAARDAAKMARQEKQ